MGALREPPVEREVSVPHLVIGAALASALLLAGFLFAASHGALPQRILNTADGANAIPSTTDPTTMAGAAIPVDGSQCALVKQAPGGVCMLTFDDTRGDLVQESLAVPVPGSWLGHEPNFDTPNNMQVLADLTRTQYAPYGRGLASMPISVQPQFASKLEAAGVTPKAFLQWLYTNVPVDQRPLWVR